MDYSFLIADASRAHEKFSSLNKRFILCDQNWNDYGYYTIHRLFLIVPDKPYNIKLADIHIFNPNQESGEKVSFDSKNYSSYLCDVESAKRLVLFLTPEERKQLLSELNVEFSSDNYKDQLVFRNSVLRGISLSQFESQQTQIKRIVTNELNVAQMVKEFVDITQLL